MRIDNLYGRAEGQDVYVCGTGPTMRVLPPDFLYGRLTIGLNQAYRYANMDYSVTVHPELVDEWRKASGARFTTWVAKANKPPLQLDLDDRDCYAFNTTDQWSSFTDHPKDTLFIGRGVQQTAMDLAVRMGARAIFLVGVDMGAVGGDHHGHDQHVRFHGLKPDDVYAEYRKWTAKARKLIREKFQIPVMSLSPILGETAADEEYKRLVTELRLPPLPRPKDTSEYTRDKADL